MTFDKFWNTTIDPSLFDPNTIGGSAIGAGIAILGAFLVIAGIIAYIYFAFTWMRIAKKIKYSKPWMAWIPFANLAMWLQMGGFNWAWIFLILIPGPGWIALWVLFIIAHWKVYEKLKFPAWLSLALALNIIPWLQGIGTLAYAIITGIIAWRKK